MRGRGIVKLHSAICTRACNLSLSHQQSQCRFLSQDSQSQNNRTTAIHTFFQQIESNYGNLSSLIDSGPASETIVSTDGLLHPQHLIRLFRHEATALHVPNFYHSASAGRLGKELIRESQQLGKNNNWKVSTSRGLESSDVGTLGEHCPYNVAVARDAQQQKQQQGTRNDDGGEESSISMKMKSPIDEYFEGVQREFHSRRRRRVSGPATNNDNDSPTSDYYQLWPLDKLRLELEESWPSGAGLARETTTTSQIQSSSKSHERIFGGGLPRIMTGPTRWKRGFIHVDELGPLNDEKGLFSANIYLKMPADETTANNGDEDSETISGDGGGGTKSDWKRDAGALYVWPLGVRSRLDWYRNAMTLSSLSAQDPEMQMKLRHVLGEPNVIRPKPGDLVLLCTQRPHCAVGFDQGTRVSLQCFLQYDGIDKRLLVDC